MTTLAGRAFPRAVLERRLRFLRAVDWYPDAAPDVALGVDTDLPLGSLPPEASLEDHLAAVVGARVVTVSQEPADPATAALVWALRGQSPVPSTLPPTPGEIAELAAFFDRQADAADPEWRVRLSDADGGGIAAVTTWARLEAATLSGDRFFGRRPAGRAWGTVSRLVWWLAEYKRRRWG